MPIKFLLLGGGRRSWGFLEGGGGSANFIFMGMGIFPSYRPRKIGNGSGMLFPDCPKIS